MLYLSRCSFSLITRTSRVDIQQFGLINLDIWAFTRSDTCHKDNTGNGGREWCMENIAKILSVLSIPCSTGRTIFSLTKLWRENKFTRAFEYVKARFPPFLTSWENLVFQSSRSRTKADDDDDGIP